VIPSHGPLHAHTTQPNGINLSWKILFPTYDFTNGETLPFLIEWDQRESERIVVSLINNQAVTNLHFGGITRQRFQEIYNLTPRKMLNTKVLRNVKVTFYEEKHLSIDIA